MKYNDNGEYKDIYVKSLDTLPVGTEVDFDGNEVPSGWTEVSGLIKSFTYTGTTNSFGNLTTNESATNKTPVFVNIGQTNSYSMYISSNGYLGVKIPDSPDTSFTITYYYIEQNDRIKKTSQYIEGGASLSNVYGTSQSNGYSQEYINGLETYSTTEQRVGTWIDGKPIYRKVINFGALPNASTKSVSHNISNLGTILDIKGTGTNGSFWFKFPHLVQDTPTNGIEISVSTTLIYIKTGSDRSAYSAYITLEYTKTTDTAQQTRSISNDEEEVEEDNR